MSHELSEISGKVEMFYAGEVPWHGLGTKVEKCLTAGEAIGAASLEWEVSQKKIFLENGTLVPGFFATVRETADKSLLPLGVVGRDYKIVQNVDAFTFMDALIGEGTAVFETAGAVKDGRRVWMLAKLSGNMVIGEADTVKKYILLVNGHDGQMPCRVFFTAVRVVCNNTLTSALATRDKALSVTIKHCGDIMSKLKVAQQVLNLAQGTFTAMEQDFNTMRRIDMPWKKAKDVVANVFPFSNVSQNHTRTENARQRVLANYAGAARGAAMAGKNGWGLYNSVTQYVDHDRYSGKPGDNEKRFDSVLFGSGAEVKARAFKAVMAMAS